MAMWEKQMHNKPRRKVQSFSSSLLDAIYHSTDESSVEDIRRNNKNSAQVEEEIESLRRAIRIEKWMDTYSTTTPRHLPSNSSGSSTDSSFFSETESSVSRRETESSVLRRETESSVLRRETESSVPRIATHKPKTSQLKLETVAKREGRFTKTKSKAMKIYGDLKKVKEPISPGGKIANFLNSIFSPRALKKDEWSSSMRKSRSMKDTATCTLASRSCLSKNPSARGNKSKRSVRFCPVSIIVDDNCRPCGEKNVYFDEDVVSSSMPTVSSKFIKRNIDSFRVYENESDDDDEEEDDKSCASSDLFELENIGRIGIGTYEEELPVYGTTSLQDIVI